MYIIIDKITSKIVQTLKPTGYVPQMTLSETQTLQQITDENLAAKIISAHDYTLIFDDNRKVIDIVISKTIEQWEAEQPTHTPQPSTEEILSQTVANLTLQNADLQSQLQTLAQTVANMQIGG